jgi:hypothetical protein
MKSRPKQALIILLTMLILASLACQLPQTTESTPTKLPITPPSIQTGITPSPTVELRTSTNPTSYPTSPSTVSTHRIATHRIYGIAGFYDRETGQNFIPRGVNYFILVPVLDHYEDRLFGMGVYSHERTQSDFATLATAGYNTIRIVLDGCTSGDGCIGIEAGQGLNPAYLDNIVDLMNMAKEKNLTLMLAMSALPELGGYAALASQGANQNISSGRNVGYLTTIGIKAYQQYWSDLLGGLVSRHAPFDVILGWELQSEQFYWKDQPPFSLSTGKVTTANGKTYDMSDSTDKQALAVEGVRYYIDQIQQTILSYDPTALITMGFFAPDFPNPWREGDNRYVETAGLLEDSALDFIDLHTYPGAGLDLPELAQNFGLGGHITKLVLMGEVGAYTWIYPNINDGAIVIQDWIADSCLQGFHGWLYYGYYPIPSGLSEATWGFMDDQNTILNALSPKHQPDACTTTILPGRNLAQGKMVNVSGALPDQSPQMAVDGDPTTQWSAGAYPTQWIEVDLGGSFSIGEIRLTVGQWPAGDVVHQLWVGTTQGAMQRAYEFSGREYDFDVLNFVPATPLKNIRYVKVISLESPAWVSWREIEVLAPYPATPTAVGEVTVTPTP